MTSSSYLISDQNSSVTIQSHPDNYLINQETGLTIDNIRKMRSWVQQKPFQRTYKLVLIESADKLSTAAQNALLKTLEEPPLNQYLFLASPHPESVLPTVRSRCEQITTNDLKNGKVVHPPDDLNWVANFVFREHAAQNVFPTEITKQNAFALAAELAKKDRVEIQNYLDEWFKYLIEENIEQNHPIADILLNTQKYLNANTNLQFTLEMMFLDIANYR